MDPNPRQAELLEEVLRQGQLSVEALAERFGVTLQTVRRDVKLLAEAGLLARFHGGVRVVLDVRFCSFECFSFLFSPASGPAQGHKPRWSSAPHALA